MMRYFSFSFLLCWVILNGCVTDYSCGDNPAYNCQPVTKIIERTDGEIYDDRGENHRNSSRSNDPSIEEDNVDRTLKSKSVLKPIKPGNPILKKPEVMRVFLPQFVDKNGDLNGSGYIYIKLKDATWENI